MLGIDSYGYIAEYPEALHGAVFGTTGTGKTTFIEHAINSYLEKGYGFAVFDQDGELSTRILGRIPKDRTNDVILIEPTADRIVPVTFMQGDDPTIIEEDIKQFFRNNWKDSWGARSEWLISNLAYALLAAAKDADMFPQFGFASFSKILSSASYREHIGKSGNLFGKRFMDLFNSFTKSFRQEVMMPILGKVDMLVRNPHVRATFGQYDSSFSFRKAMDRGQIIIVKIPQGELGDMSRMIGSAVFTMITREALLRENTRPFLLCLDECQTYTQGIDLSQVLATSRKYGLFLLLATTNLELLPNEMQAAIFANCSTKAVFRTSARDARILAPELATNSQPRTIQILQNFEFLYVTMGDLLPTNPVPVRLAAPLYFDRKRSERVRRASLKRWGRPRERVETLILKHLGK